jgi:hypothetical protein
MPCFVLSPSAREAKKQKQRIASLLAPQGGDGKQAGGLLALLRKFFACLASHGGKAKYTGGLLRSEAAFFFSFASRRLFIAMLFFCYAKKQSKAAYLGYA